MPLPLPPPLPSHLLSAPSISSAAVASQSSLPLTSVSGCGSSAGDVSTKVEKDGRLAVEFECCRCWAEKAGDGRAEEEYEGSRAGEAAVEGAFEDDVADDGIGAGCVGEGKGASDMVASSSAVLPFAAPWLLTRAAGAAFGRALLGRRGGDAARDDLLAAWSSETHRSR